MTPQELQEEPIKKIRIPDKRCDYCDNTPLIFEGGWTYRTLCDKHFNMMQEPINKYKK